ncbi:unnamed protein product [Somion occarium]|uniref:R3H domain-containing protein n=1 Tax=Somion occarium TaxID=3059160 RepID=A0ABP1DQ76_9APHY
MSAIPSPAPVSEHITNPKQLNKRRGPARGTPETGGESSAQGLTNVEAGPSRQYGEPHKRRPYRTRKPRAAGDGSGVDLEAGHSGLSAPTSETPGENLPPQPRRDGRPSRNRERPRRSDNAAPGAPSEADVAAKAGEAVSPSAATQKADRNKRGVKFNPNLTDSKDFKPKPAHKYRSKAPKADDLTSRLIHSLSRPPYADCPICFSAIHPAQPSWSCSPLIPISPVTDEKESSGEASRTAETAQCCWTTFHLKCIRSWASKSVKDLEDAWRARGDSRKAEWRCPGCQAKRLVVPTSYWCFCGSTPDPKPPRLATPHSCGGPCTRPRACGHPCSLSCHPGPCPPCQITIQLPCHCGRRSMSFRCSHLSLSKVRQAPPVDLSCGNKCGKKLNCANHACEDVCHDGPCKPCPVTYVAKCYCGKEEKDLRCGEGIEKASAIVDTAGEHNWIGQFPCENVCNRAFDCGIHHCQKPCHPQDPSPSTCPRSPSLVTHCPCGKHELSPSTAEFFPPASELIRTTCTDPVPTCESTCMKPLDGCEHACSAKCHIGPCPPCSIMLVRPCRCGSTTRNVKCSEEQVRMMAREHGEPDSEILCDRLCTALRNCGRHQCNRVCCPLASLAPVTRGKGKKKAAALFETNVADEEGWHECDLVCGKMLSCGNHKCEERDHKGACRPCLRSSFEEMICHCGRTILEPPIPCGTRIHCSYPCDRPPPPCGHPMAPHICHEDPNPCPPCIFLSGKRCACGKKIVDNVRCSQEKVSCGTTCGKLLSCGFHHCERLCHGDSCGPCTAVCGKPRKLCLPAHHPCTLPCHAPAACSEAESCRSVIYITCPCGRIRQPVPCGRSTANPAGREGSQQLKCSNECLIAKRNARLAEALGITPESREESRQQIIYSDELLSFARANPKFCAMVEKSFSDFLSSGKKNQILAHMPEVRRKFVHDLAAVYRMDTQMVDQEPHRSVQLIQRIDSRVPTPTLSTAASSTPPASSMHTGLGKLADLRAPVSQQSTRPTTPAWSRASTPASTSAAGNGRGWTSVVTQRPTAKTDVSPTAWLTDSSARAAAAQNPPVPSTSRVAQAPPGVPVPSTSQAAEDVPESWEDEH